MCVGDRSRPLTNPGLFASVDDVGTLDVKSPKTFAGKIAGVGSMVENSRVLMSKPCALERLS